MRRLAPLGLLVLCACPPPPVVPELDAGPGDQCVVDLNFDAASADDITLGEARTGLLCPQRDQDFYRFEVTTPGSIVRVRLSMLTNITPIEPAYTILTGAGDPTGISASDPDVTAGTPVDFEGAHRIEEAGTYLVVVADLEGFDDGFDIANEYTLEVNLEPDPDANEPNNTDELATVITPGTPITGQIATTGDEDWYAIPVEQDAQIIDLSVTAPAEIALDLVVELFRPDAISLLDGSTLTDASPADPNNAALVAERIRAAASGVAGTVFYLRVTEAAGRAELDPALATFTINVTLLADPDVQEAGGGNNVGEDATALVENNTLTGSIATRADQDVFVISPPGAPAPNNPQVLIVDIDFDASAPDFQPQIQILAHDPELIDGDLTLCAAQEPRCPDINNGGDAVPDPIDTICLPNGLVNACGRPLIQRILPDGGAYSLTAPVRRARPLYVQINELGDDNFQEGTNYTISARFIDDPDPGEVGDDFLIPNLQIATYDNVGVLETQLSRSRGRARNIGGSNVQACAPPATGDAGPDPDAGPVDNTTCIDQIPVPEPQGLQNGFAADCNDPLATDFTVSGTGVLAYEGDRDYFVFNVPDVGYWGLDMNYTISTTTPVELAVFTHFGGELNTSFVEATIDALLPGTQRCEGGCCDVLGCCAPTDQACLDSHVCIEGNCFVDAPANPAVSNVVYPQVDECFFVHVNDEGRPLFVEITDNGINDFDTQMVYDFQIQVQCGCPAACDIERFPGVFACQGVSPP